MQITLIKSTNFSSPDLHSTIRNIQCNFFLIKQTLKADVTDEDLYVQTNPNKK